ncbi:sulfotransferase family 2 domain-containing protein [Thetidibacter halocola]|uniref:Sulfotransferase family 2 domain-containing protein n=1 Tax=Thetidibacter halocola TaxID=2827239 RepID=A0A8J8B829_9RHOB|nr:sulfotransferase family 2 domain-containing protein [Thetidibacter halocola]MBS0122748.1 sulfotransferase family 2 domain-containing protein [Thetidibacter halocola]
MVVALAAYRIAWMPLPKAACSSVKEALARIDPAVTVPDAPTTHSWHQIYPTRRFRPHRWQGYGDHWRFCVVRDPLERLLSVYTNRVVQHRDLWNSRRLRDDPAFRDLPRDPDPDTFFQQLPRYRLASSAIRHHAFPAWVFLGPELRDYDRVFRVAELDALAAALTERTGRWVVMPRRNRSAERLSADDLRPATLAALRALLAEEYDYLSGVYQNPLGAPLMALARSGGGN